ncbi:MAG: ABC transporter permease [Chloroflexi bacterium]|nr:ABC transporter permease [Chloroflexota bacterium]MCI0578973.1 ABC transporter permease [Chloroflexota bacterium]MCI0645089.1 ABC transporter permease [Chloroflexota bacterium]MCI0731924.1 ABC transporter permease [Chloroflexota bacterium]
MLLTTFFNETHKGLLLDWHYKFNLFIELIIMGVAFVGISFLIGGGAIQQVQLAPALLGYLVWFYAMKIIVSMSWNLKDEMQTGTLEQMYLSPTPAGLLILGQSLARLLSTTVIMLPLAGGLILLLDIEIPLRPAGLLVFALTIVGLFGFGFLIAGATLIFKQVQALADLIQYALVFLNGALIPIDRFPGWLAAVAQALPTTQGIVVLRQVVLEGQSLGEVWAGGSLVWLGVHSAATFLGGWFFFKWCERAARQQGLLGQY